MNSSSRAFPWIVGSTAALLSVIFIASCSAPHPAPVVVAEAQPQIVQAAPQVVSQAPVVVQQAPAHDGFLTGMLMGHLMSGGGGGSSHTTVNKTIVNKTTVVRPQAVQRPSPVYRPSYSSRTSSFSSARSGRR